MRIYAFVRSEISNCLSPVCKFAGLDTVCFAVSKSSKLVLKVKPLPENKPLVLICFT